MLVLVTTEKTKFSGKHTAGPYMVCGHIRCICTLWTYSRCQYSFSIFGGMDRWIHGPKSKSFSCSEDYPQKTDLLHPGLWKLACTHHAILRLSASSATFGLHDSPTNPTSYSSDSIRASWRCHGSGLGQFSSGRLHHIQTALQASDLHLGSAS